MDGFSLLIGHLIGDYLVQNDWMAANKTKSTWACLVHCVCYTSAVFAACWWVFPAWWFYGVVCLLHFPMDRWRLARRFMTWNRQEAFAVGPLAPWSIVVVDNTIHLLVLWSAALAYYGLRG